MNVVSNDYHEGGISGYDAIGDDAVTKLVNWAFTDQSIRQSVNTRYMIHNLNHPTRAVYSIPLSLNQYYQRIRGCITGVSQLQQQCRAYFCLLYLGIADSEKEDREFILRPFDL